ncbi:MAG: hypothetical protein ACYTEQ_22940 [Planctomycetota bacterium]
MKRFAIVWGTVVFLFCAGLAEGREKNRIRLECQIFRLAGNVPAQIRANDKIWTTDEPPEALKNKVTVFSRGRFALGKDKLEFRKGRCFWNKTEIPLAGPEKIKLPEKLITMVYEPVVIEMDEHSKGWVNIESKQPIQYFEKRDDGLFELKEIELPTGLYVEITEPAEEEEKGYILLTDIFRVRPGKDYGILIRPEWGQGSLLIRLRASSTRSGTIGGSNQKNEPDE